MPILEKITEAEKKASELKQIAMDDVEKLLADTEAENNLKVQKMIEETNKKILEKSNETKQRIIELDKISIQEYLEESKKDQLSAKNHHNETIDFIVRKVVNS